MRTWENRKRDIFKRRYIPHSSKSVFFWVVLPRKLSLRNIGVMDMSYIMDSVQIGYTQLSLTFFHYYRPIRPIYHTSENFFFEKMAYFLVENVL